MVWGSASPNLRLARQLMWSRTVASTAYTTRTNKRGTEHRWNQRIARYRPVLRAVYLDVHYYTYITSFICVMYWICAPPARPRPWSASRCGGCTRCWAHARGPTGGPCATHTIILHDSKL